MRETKALITQERGFVVFKIPKEDVVITPDMLSINNHSLKKKLHIKVPLSSLVKALVKKKGKSHKFHPLSTLWKTCS